MKLDHEVNARTQTHLGRSGIAVFPSKTIVTLIICIFSCSDDGSKWRLLSSLLHPTTKHPNRLIGDILSSPSPEPRQWWTALSSLSVGHSESRRMTDELGSRQRDLSTSSVTKRANGHWHAIIASSCRWSQREYKRQPVHRINHPFASEPSGGVSLLLFLTLRVRSFTSAGVTAQQRWSRSHGRTTVREDSHTGVCGGQLPCVLQH